MDNLMMPRQYPIGFRANETAYVMERWIASQSCSLVGIGSVGKSNLLRHLASQNVLGHYLGKDQSERIKAIIIDPNMLGSLPADSAENDALRAWAGYELLMHRLFLAFYPFDMLSKEDASRFYESYQILQDGSNPLYAYMALRYFELGLQFFMRQGYKIIFMFDEFEELLRQMPIKFFQNLRGIRDANKNQLAYLTFTRTPIKVAASQLQIASADIEPFEELFTDNIYFVGPYNSEDAINMLIELGNRSGKHISEAWANALIDVTGGYAGLLRSAFSLIDPLAAIPDNDDPHVAIATFLLARTPIRAECKTIWMSLTPPERTLLKAVAHVSPYDKNADVEQAVAQLVQKRLLTLNVAQQLEIQPLVFRLYVASNREDV
jgi:hypothetical protein